MSTSETSHVVDTFSADNVAAVIDACEELRLESMRSEYKRIAIAKALIKELPSEGPQGKNTLGIAFAVRPPLPQEVIAQQLDRLNEAISECQWLDVVAVVPTGTIS
jgi:hypothetical protein